MTEPAIELVPLDWRNVAAAQRLATRIFPREARAIFQSLVGSLLPDLLRSILGNHAIIDVAYYIAIAPGQNDCMVGLTGLYRLRHQPSDVWLGWYGVAVHRRHGGFGRAILRATIGRARSRGQATLRLWTTMHPTWTTAAIKLYREFGFVPQSTGYTYYGHAVQIHSLGLKGPATSLDPANIPAAFIGADRRKLAPIANPRLANTTPIS
jgi:GNAT superfamily N-acetyltransferase